MNDEVKFKKILEYFVTHLRYVENDEDKSIPGYEQYLKKWVDNESFKKSGQGYNGDGIQNQVGEFNPIRGEEVCISIQSNFGSLTTSACYLNWGKSLTKIIAEWDDDDIIALKIMEAKEEYVCWDEDKAWLIVSDTTKGWREVSIKSLEDLGLFDNNETVTDTLEEFLEKFDSTHQEEKKLVMKRIKK